MSDDTFFNEAFEELKMAGILEDSLFVHHPEVLEKEDPIPDAQFEEVENPAISEETMPVHEAIKLYLKGTPSIGVNWLASRCFLSKKKLKQYLETGQGLQPVHVMSIVGTLQEKAERINNFEQLKLEKSKALAAL